MPELLGFLVSGKVACDFSALGGAGGAGAGRWEAGTTPARLRSQPGPFKQHDICKQAVVTAARAASGNFLPHTPHMKRKAGTAMTANAFLRRFAVTF